MKKVSEFQYTTGKVPKVTSNKRKSRDLNEIVKVREAWYKRSILFYLEYWSFHKVRHVLDVMHTEKNVAEHLISTIIEDKAKTKDTINARLNTKELGIHNGQWMQIDGRTGKQVKPKASFMLDKQEKREFCKILNDLMLPSSFSSNLSNIVTLNPPGLHSMKSHDCHVIMDICYMCCFSMPFQSTEI